MKDYNKVLEFINTYKEGDYVYQGVIKRKFGLDAFTTHLILDEMVDNKILERIFTILCSECGHENDNVLKSLNQITEDDLVCGKCRRNLDVLEDIILQYRKL